MSVDADVLVVGSGPVGLALAIELGTRGVRVIVAERQLRGGTAPRAKTTNVRTRTHLRRWGIADALAAASPLGIDYPNDVVFVTRLAERRLAHFKDAFNAAPARCDLYPEHAQWVPQYTLERIMRERVAALPTVEVRFDTTFVTADQDGDRVVARLRDGGGERTVAARYLLGADGARSAVRELIGAKMEGRYGLSRNYNIVFRAPGLAAAHPQPRAVMYWQADRHGASVVGPMDEDDVWFFMPLGMKKGATLSKDEAAQSIVRATGVDLPYEILSSDEWVASRLLADRYRSGRIFLAGDACHLHPPFGGYGMNMGVGDGVDLGWKIAARLQGWGGPALLDSYEIERRHVHEAVIEEAIANHAMLGEWREELDADGPEGDRVRQEVGERILAAKAREFHTLGTVLGLAYDASPVIAREDGAAPARNGATYRPSARPGCLAPHAWMRDGRSLYDLFGTGFTLVVADGADADAVSDATREADALGVPLEVLRPDGVAVKDLYQADLTLVRPDQHVAWRGAHWTRGTLRQVSGNAGEATP